MRTGGLILIVDFRPTPEQLSQEMKVAGFEPLQVLDRWQGQPDVYASLFRKLD